MVCSPMYVKELLFGKLLNPKPPTQLQRIKKRQETNERHQSADFLFYLFQESVCALHSLLIQLSVVNSQGKPGRLVLVRGNYNVTGR